MREPMLTSGDLTPKICFEISPQHEFTFYGSDGQVVGTMNFSRTPAFEGSLDESAHLFFNGVVNLWNNEISELRAKLQAAEIDTEVVKDLLTTERECNADLRRILGHTPELDPEATYKSLHHDYIIVRDNRDELSTKLQAAELVIKEMSGAQFGLYHNRLRDGSGKCGEPCGVCRAETAEAECAALVAQRDALPQTEMALRTEVARLEAEVARLQSEIQLITAPIEAGGGENARLRTRIAELEAEVARLLDVGADAFHEVNTLHAAKDAMETDLIYVTSQMDEHPDGYEGPCWCRVCRSYATDDGEDGK